jgi:hypothetical protein
MSTTENSLNEYFDEQLPHLKVSYDWKIPDLVDFKQSNEKGYLANVALKHHLHERYLKANFEKRFQLAHFVIAEWGGVRGNKPETIKKYVKLLETENPITDLNGVASYSKLFSIFDPKKYAIYDARVAACLNAIQLNAGIEQGLAFNYIPGRNNIVGNSIKRSGFTQEPRFKRSALIKRGWQSIARANTYQTYLDVLKRCLVNFPKYQLFDLEMILFANAEIECSKASKLLV